MGNGTAYHDSTRAHPRLYRRCLASLLSGAKVGFAETSVQRATPKNNEKPGGTTAGQRKHLIAGDFANSIFAFCQNSADMDRVIGDYAQADPPFHPGVAPVEAAPKTVPSLEHRSEEHT